MSQSVNVTLSSPIKAHGTIVDALTLRPPTGKDIRLAGYPMSFDKNGGSTVEAEPMAKMISLLAGIPPSSVDQLVAADWTGCLVAVMGFFGGTTPEASSTDTGSSPAGGATSTTSSGSPPTN